VKEATSIFLSRKRKGGSANIIFFHEDLFFFFCFIRGLLEFFFFLWDVSSIASFTFLFAAM